MKNIEELHTQSLKTNMTDMIKPLYILMILAVITSCVFTEDTERVVTIDSNEKAFGCNSFEFIIIISKLRDTTKDLREKHVLFLR